MRELRERAGGNAGGGPVVFKPYVTADSGKSVQEVFATVNTSVHMGYGTDFRYGGAGKIVATSLREFENLISELAAIEHLEFMSHVELLAEPCPADRIRVGIRHDIDMDIVAALEQARIEKEYGVRANWVVLHTAPYYGEFVKGVFHRHESMAYVYRKLQELGHEVSLHTDALHLYQKLGIDGAQAIVEELNWLRSNGIGVRGTTAHNHWPVYGAENFEVFKGYVHPRELRAGAAFRDHVVHEGRFAPLHVLDECELGLLYEGNEVFWQKHTPLAYGATRLANRWNWRAHQDRLRRESELVDQAFMDQARLLREIRRLQLGCYLVLVIHPVYYGLRDSTHTSPVFRKNRLTCSETPDGWLAYEPDTAQCWSGVPEAEQEFQAVHFPNARGMLDFPGCTQAAQPAADSRLRILVLGADNLDGLPVLVPIQLPAVLAELIQRYTGVMPFINKIAFPGMGVTRLWPWFKSAMAEFEPQLVILGIGDQGLRQNLPQVWSLETGISHLYPAGEYLRWNPDRHALEECGRSEQWKAHRVDGRAIESYPGTSFEVVRLPPPDAKIEEIATTWPDYLGECYRKIGDYARDRGAACLLLVEANGEAAGGLARGSVEAARYRASVSAALAALASKLHMPLADPYPSLEQLGDELPAYGLSDFRWNSTGHRVAATVVFETMRREGMV